MNLMCPARLILLPSGSRERLAGERIAAVYATPAVAEPAAALADDLGVSLTVLRPQHLAQADATQAEQWPVEDVLRGIADQHRGETVVVIAPELDLSIDVPAVIEHEGDGWYVVAPGGTPG
ncbi:hypothetical protein [Kribbella sp. NPDC051620]|uniref:hypothetical protein n=1 Tax=Kribbella sp. NPDC051620 TaxID=3364120 RepID=UPI0037A7FF69